MKDKAEKESEKLIELYKNLLYPDEKVNTFIPDLVKEKTIKASIIDVSNTIEALNRLDLYFDNHDSSDNGWWYRDKIGNEIDESEQVKKILEDKLK